MVSCYRHLVLMYMADWTAVSSLFELISIKRIIYNYRIYHLRKVIFN